MATESSRTVHLLDYGAGNVCSIRNAIKSLGFTIKDITAPEQVAEAGVLVFPGVGAFGSAMGFLHENGYVEPLRRFIQAGRPFFGICIGLQCMFEGSAETPGVEGLGVIPGTVDRFPASDLSVPHIGWNGLRAVTSPASSLLPTDAGDKAYFVHSFRAPVTDANRPWVAAVTDYGAPFIAVVEKGLVCASQCHPEKSGKVGLGLLSRFFERSFKFLASGEPAPALAPAGEALPIEASAAAGGATRLARRIVACLDVRSNDDGDLVVTKGDQYDVRTADSERSVRNLGKPVELCARYYAEGADEVTFLNITAFRDSPLEDQPMLAVLEAASSTVFVPLTVGGGIRGYTDATGKTWSALDVAARYFRAGADKVSIGSDAVLAAEAYYARGSKCAGDTAIEAIAEAYGSQAVVISVDPRRVYVSDPSTCPHHTVKTAKPGPAGEEHCWFQCTIKGGREGRELSAFALAQACEALGAGELLINCIDNDGQGAGFDLELMTDLCSAVSIPVIASSGAGNPTHFQEVFEATRAEAALAAGIFHRKEVGIDEVKAHLAATGVETRV